jgi:hypothetical protein
MSNKIELKAGSTFGRLTFIEESRPRIRPSGQKTRRVFCKCTCGNFKEVDLFHLIRGNISSCGCMANEPTRESVLGIKYGMLTVIEELPDVVRKGRPFRYVKVQCECGTVKDVVLQGIKKLKSCGCKTKEILAQYNVKHGMTKHPIYAAWSNMKNRCFNPNVTHWGNYGGRGITVCDEWVRDFRVFCKWAMDNGWEQGLELDRINVHGNYEPSNCRWVTEEEQANNKTTSHYVEYNGERLTISQLCEKYGLLYGRVHARITELKWSVVDAVEREKIELEESMRIAKEASMQRFAGRLLDEHFKDALRSMISEAERRVARCIADDIDFGYNLDMIRHKIKGGAYIDTSLEAMNFYKKLVKLIS